MISLDLPSGPYRLALDGTGVVLEVEPPTQAMVDVAMAKASRAVRSLVDAWNDLKDAGATITGLMDLSDPDVRDGVAQAEFRKALAGLAIRSWEGVPAECDSDGKRRFAETYPLGQVFELAYLRPLEDVAAEGKGSGPAPNGTSAAGPDIV